MERARDAGRLRPLGSPADGFGPQGDPRARAHPPLRQGLPVCQPRIRLGTAPARHQHQHDGMRGPEGERAGGTRQRHDEERAAQGHGVPRHCPSAERDRTRRGVLQQGEAEHEHRHDDALRGGRKDRRDKETMDQLQACRHKKQARRADCS